MGYYMYQVNSVFMVRAKNIKKALRAIKALAGKETIMDGSGPHFSWVRTDDFLRAKDFSSAMGAWRWQTETNAEGNIYSVYFIGEKSGDDLILFDAIAPYVEKGSYIEMRGEDETIWRWVFDGKTCKELIGRVVWRVPT